MIICDNCSPRKQCTEDKNREKCKFYQPMTNEEWLETLSTEEKAEVLNDLYWEFDYKARLYYNFEPTKKSFEKWLKGIHDV